MYSMLLSTIQADTQIFESRKISTIRLEIACVTGFAGSFSKLIKPHRAIGGEYVRFAVFVITRNSHQSNRFGLRRRKEGQSCFAVRK